MKFKLPRNKKKKEASVVYKKPTGGIVWNKPNQMSSKELKELRKRNTKMNKVKKANSEYRLKNPLKSRNFRILLFILVIFAFFWQVLPRYSDLPFFKIKKIEILGLEQVNQEVFNQSVEQYRGKSLINANTQEIKTNIKQQYDFIQEVYVRKIMPDTLQLEVVEKFPVMAYVNLKGAYLLDKNYTVVSIRATNVKPVTDDDLKLVSNEIDVNSTYLKERYLLTIEDSEERSTIKWEEVDQTKKTELLDKLKKEANDLIFSIQNELIMSVKDSEFPQLVVVTSNSRVDYKKNDQIEFDKNDFVIRLYGRIKEQNIVVLEIKWISEYTLQLKLQDNKTFLFTNKRTIEDQMADLETIIYSDVINQGSVFDLRSDTYSVK